MRIKKMNDVQQFVAVSLGFTLVLLAIRAFYTGSVTYFFYPWNLFLALVPVFISGLLIKQRALNYKGVLLFALWLLFLPNAPYLVTDIFHFEQRPPVPFWFDLILVVSGAWNGILLCMISLFRVERFLKISWNSNIVSKLMPLIIVLCGYGVYIGRYLRYNSWDVVTEPLGILRTSTHHIHHPFQNLNVWLFTFVFASFLGIIYFTIKKLPRVMLTPGQF